MSHAAFRLSAVLLATLALAGCAAPKPAIPTVEWRDNEDAMRILADRARSVRTVSATGLITLTRWEDESSVRFDAALVTEPPDRLRLRAWKIGRAIFDLTLTPQGLWLLSPQDPSLRDKVKAAGVGAGDVARQWSLLSGAFFERTDLVASLSGKDLILEAPAGDLRVRCYVDRQTLVPRLYLLQDDRNSVRFSLNLGDYRMVGPIPYPHRAEAASESGRILVQFDDVELNTELAPAAFIPPRRAEMIEP